VSVRSLCAAPRVRDRGGEGSERIRFSSAILPPYARRSKSLEVLIPILYLKVISTGDFEDALGLGGSARQMSASVFHPSSGRPDCLADDAVNCEPVSTSNSLVTGKLTGNFAASDPPLRFRCPVNE
jgi:hypothetical protein